MSADLRYEPVTFASLSFNNLHGFYSNVDWTRYVTPRLTSTLNFTDDHYTLRTLNLINIVSNLDLQLQLTRGWSLVSGVDYGSSKSYLPVSPGISTLGLPIGLNYYSTHFQGGFPKDGHPTTPQGPYYCGVGYKYMGSLARKIVEEHLELCLAAGINHEGINAEVAKGQWEFQIFAKGSAKAADDTWTARYLMMRLCEKYEVDVVLHCKPIKGDWNGSGMHCNFSTKYIREVGGMEYFEALMKAFSDNVAEHIAVYGPDNTQRFPHIGTSNAANSITPPTRPDSF